MTNAFTTREVAELAHVSVRAIDKAVEENVLTGVRSVMWHGKKRRMLPLHAVPYAAIIKQLPVTLGRIEKKNLARALAARSPARMTSETLEIAPAVSIDVPRLIGGGLAERAANYARVRDTHIEENPDILGGTPVIKGTRLSVYAIRGRLDGGESIDAIIDDYPQLGREAIEAALLYARSHPLVGRPGGRPWTKAA